MPTWDRMRRRGLGPRGRRGLLVLMLVLPAPAACPAADEPAPAAAVAKVRIALAGDSTVTDQSGWGPGLAAHLGPDAECLNLARSGRSSRSYRDEGHWKKVLEAKPDYILIQFGYNDQPGKGPERETDPATSYREFLSRCVDEARAIGARPILVTSLARRLFDSEGKIRTDLAPYAEAARAVAGEKKVPLVDLYARSVELLERIGPDASAEFDPMPAGARTGTRDRTHLSPRGAAVFGAIVADELKAVEPALAPRLR